MPTSEHKYSIDDLIAALLRDQGIHDGHWALNIEFSATGAAVKQGEKIMLAGNTGDSLCNMVHMEVLVGPAAATAPVARAGYKVTIPFVGKRLETEVARGLRAALEVEGQIGAKWLASQS